ncbi:hypothetical protein [Zoogloea sp.]|uniref:hypothetical protein n=1 Tax=Zoogloea sp. TaxID=49181 RepID=UPI001416D48D|nr:MAG: hypothetical protein F9K15_22040 [Zoogloea sp.]
MAGFAFGGDFASAADRFPYTFKLFKAQSAAKNQQGGLSYLVSDRAKSVKNPDFEFTPGGLVSLKSSDKALMAVLMLTGETVAVDNFGAYHKTFIALRGDALIFDYKSQTIVRSCPVVTVLFDAQPQRPSDEHIEGFVNNMIRRDDEKGLVSQFAQCLERSRQPRDSGHTVQVRRAEAAPEAIAMLPQSLRKSPAAIEALIADLFSSALSSKLGISMLPSSIGHAIGGVMTMRLENGDDYKIKLNEGDYVFDLRLNKFAKIKVSENNVGTAYVFGTYFDIKFLEPTLNTVYLDSSLKNGETAVLPAGLVTGDDFAAYQDAMRGLALKFSDSLANPGSKWISSAASAKNISSQLDSARDILGKCK